MWLRPIMWLRPTVAQGRQTEFGEQNAIPVAGDSALN
jgi:hypothetical protein